MNFLHGNFFSLNFFTEVPGAVCRVNYSVFQDLNPVCVPVVNAEGRILVAMLCQAQRNCCTQCCGHNFLTETSLFFIAASGSNIWQLQNNVKPPLRTQEILLVIIRLEGDDKPDVWPSLFVWRCFILIQLWFKKWDLFLNSSFLLCDNTFGKQSYSGNVCTRINEFDLLDVEKQRGEFCWSINRMIFLYLLLFFNISLFCFVLF